MKLRGIDEHYRGSTVASPAAAAQPSLDAATRRLFLRSWIHSLKNNQLIFPLMLRFRFASF